ncbi:MAG: PqqD family protein [Thermodesulfobacteriota bacterium]
MFRKKQPPEKLTRTQALACIPVKGGHVQESRIESGEILLAYPDYKQPWLARLIRRLGSNENDGIRIKKLQLDALGTSVWELLDGRRSVQQVIDLFAQKYSLHPKEAEVSVSQFLRELGLRELIGLR